MGKYAAYFLAAAIIIALFALLYWTRPARKLSIAGQSRSVTALLILVATGIGFILWSVLQDRADYTFDRQPNPLAIAIAFDLSPSMLATPNPDFDGQYPPRFERAKTVLLEFFRALEEQREPLIVSVVGFTRQADILMGWDQSTTQVRDILEYAVSPDLFGSSGTSIEAAVKSINDVFAMLPADLQSTSRKLAIIVSDGEDTMRASSFGYAEAKLSEATFDTIALQAGLFDRNEGIPVFGRVGEFLEFRNMSGAVYTVPDAEAMNTIANVSLGRGLFVRAETPEAVERMLRFAVGVDASSGPDAAWLSTFGMFAVVSLLCAVILR